MNAQGLLLDGTLDAVDYKEIKGRLEPHIRTLQGKLSNISGETNDMDQMLQYGTRFFQNLDRFYLSGDLTARQQIIGSIFPEKLIFENKTFRTALPNPLLALICRPDADSTNPKNRKSRKNSANSTLAPTAGLEPATL